MRRIISFLLIFVVIFLFGCSKEEIMEVEKITAAVIDEIEVEDKEVPVIVEEEKEEIVTVRLCHDTDNGIVRWVNGSIFGFYGNSTRFEFKDYCQNKNYLMEFYCEDENPKQFLFLCRNGCEDDHCA